MSIELVLIPIGIATVSAAKTFFSKEAEHVSVSTVMKDEAVLQQALDNYGYANEFRDVYTFGVKIFNNFFLSKCRRTMFS